MKNVIYMITLVILTSACNEKYRKIDQNDVVVGSEMMDSVAIDTKNKSQSEIREELLTKGYQIFDYVDEATNDTIIMQQYFMAFLKSGPNRMQNEEESQRLQKEHLAHLGKMYDMGYADISGPFGDDGDIRGITIYNVPNIEMADSLANADPMVKAGRLVIEIHPWWAAKGFKLR